MKGKRILMCALGAVLIIMMLLMSACACIHKWQEASCIAPKTCARCGITEGEKMPHSWGDTGCMSFEPCSVCGTTEGMELSHQWMEDRPVCSLCGLDERPTDERFIDSLSQGLEAALDLKAQFENVRRVPASELLKMYAVEYEHIAAYREESFEDSQLQTLAQQYIDHLVSTMEILEATKDEDWKAANNDSVSQKQDLLLFRMHSILPISVSEENQLRLMEMLGNGETLDMVAQLFDDIYFHQIKNPNGTYRYEAKVENITSQDFVNFTFIVDLLDEEGKVVDTHRITENGWEAGEKRWFIFYPQVKFDSIKIRSATWLFSWV